MYVKVLLCSVCLFVLTLSASAVASYNVVLNNGETIEAESYTIKGETITLHYKMGKASFPKGAVKSITEKSGKVLLLSEPGKKPPKQKDTTSTRPISAGTGFKPATGINMPPKTGQPETKEKTEPADDEFYEGMWPEEKDFMKGKEHPLK
jgi:hypothetical protein